jgi:precorrin-6A/cobalt-precorrin-6A reductase
MPRLRLLILGGAGDARALAAAAVDLPGVDVTSSLAGRTTVPQLPPGRVRIGGFGGPDGLAAYLRAEQIDAVIDATHPFAATMTANAVAAAATTGVPLLVLRRPGWSERPGDAWRRVPTLDAAAAILPSLGERVFLTTGRQGIAAFARVDRCWFLARSVEPPDPPVPARLTVLLDRGPFPLDAERALLAEHRIDVLVSKDSGGTAAAAKLTAARERGIPVVLIDRPALPAGARSVETADEAVSWLRSALNGAGQQAR